MNIFSSSLVINLGRSPLAFVLSVVRALLANVLYSTAQNYAISACSLRASTATHCSQLAATNFEARYQGLFKSILDLPKKTCRTLKTDKSPAHEFVLVYSYIRIPRISPLQWESGQQIRDFPLLGVALFFMGTETASDVLTAHIKLNATAPTKKPETLSMYLDN
ncbi:hypothetical protein DL96DRAFT_1719572 [Flagelloscypha sp. PMI_526]|nr:hypothetical protein DL96DRAFT_1719572 [Flagelloscypha sp. PMI_526]